MIHIKLEENNRLNITNKREDVKNLFDELTKGRKFYEGTIELEFGEFKARASLYGFYRNPAENRGEIEFLITKLPRNKIEKRIYIQPEINENEIYTHKNMKYKFEYWFYDSGAVLKMIYKMGL